MSVFSELLATLERGGDPGPFALLRREIDGELADHLDVLTGDITVVPRLADIPLPPSRQPGPATLALVPYRQLTERGFACVDDGAPLECLRVSAAETVGLTQALAALPTAPPQVAAGEQSGRQAAPPQVAAGEQSGRRPGGKPSEQPGERPADMPGEGFDLTDEEYAGIVDDVLRDEIGRGEGANFVIHRVFESGVRGNPVVAGLAALRRLLVGERGAYWTFLVHTGTRTLIGATPERHVSVADGLVMMNPISGTYRRDTDAAARGANAHAGEHARHHAGPRTEPRTALRAAPTGARDTAGLLRFLSDPKEIDELYMVLDEELKMMATVAEHGGQVVGPYLKEMSHVIHTEYLLAGRSTLDVRDVLRETMFAPTVTGSPIENACRVIARHERRGRGYYAGVLALLGHDDAGRQTLDAPILIRTAEISPEGALRVPVGATLVRHSTAAGEVAETHAKAAGVLAALALGPHTTTAMASAATPTLAAPLDRLADDPRVRAALAARNTDLARFWLEDRGTALDDRGTATETGALTGLRALVVDAEDTFTGMLAHQLRSLGLAVAVRPYTAAARLPLDDFDLVLAGPGPGDPTDLAAPKMATLRTLIAELLDRRQPLLGVCLGHQILAGLLGLPLHRRTTPYQGLRRTVDLFGHRRLVGFYSTFTPLSDRDELVSPYGPARLARDGVDGAVHALRGPTFAGVQFHPESVLSRDGLAVLSELVTDVCSATVPTSEP